MELASSGAAKVPTSSVSVATVIGTPTGPQRKSPTVPPIVVLAVRILVLASISLITTAGLDEGTPSAMCFFLFK